MLPPEPGYRKDTDTRKRMLTRHPEATAEDAVQLVAWTAPVTGRDAIADAIRTLPCELRNFSLQDADLRRLTSDVVVLSYTATQDSSCEGKPLPAEVRATAVYVRQKGSWLQASYQETPLQ